MRNIYKIFAFLLIAIYFLISIFTLGNYGTNWDEVHHSTRGQAYLYFFLTGKRHYDKELFDKGNRYSFYQIPAYDFTKQKQIDGDHPVFSDIMSSLSNYIFYQKLGIMDDFDSYHLYGPVLVSLFLVFLFFWVERYFSGFTAFISVLSLILYPLFYGESHFNVQKDIPEAVYYGLAIMAFYTGYVKKSAKWIIASSLFFGFALGTKFNILFMPIILILWLLIKEKHKIFSKLLLLPLKVKISLAAFPFIAFAIFFGSWPHLWYDPIKNILQVFGYYKSFGIEPAQSMPASYYILGFNTYAVQWILYATPFTTLFLFAFGLLYVALKGWKEKNKTSLLILLWFLIPIIRVTFPNASIYGGVRQIMEYIPAMAILSGIGAGYLVKLLKFPKSFKLDMLARIVIILLFIPISFKMWQMHPNESIYFNELIGGLKGAKERNIPGWGNSLGSAYRQGVNWLNTHAQKNAKVALLSGNISNIPNALLREDIKYSNIHRSGPGRQGEHIVGVTHFKYDENYHSKYLERFLDPVYEVKVDGVPVLKIWKNDREHAKPQYRKEEEEVVDFLVTKGEAFLWIDLKEAIQVTRIYIRYNPNNCTPPTLGYFEHSILGDAWESEHGDFASLPFSPWFRETQKEENILRYVFAGGYVRFIRVIVHDKNSCLLSNPIEIELYRI